jgi:hypothetical protein
LRLPLSTGLGICCSVQTINASKPGKYFSISSAGVLATLFCCMFSVELVYNLVPSSEFFICICADVTLIGVKEKAYQSVGLCKDDSIKSIKNLFFKSSLKCLPAPISLFRPFLLDKRFNSYLPYLFAIFHKYHQILVL